MASGAGYAGRLVAVEISWNRTDWLRFGGVRNRADNNSTETADATSDDSGLYREVVETFIAGDFSIDGVIKRDNRAEVLERFELFYYDPSREMDENGVPYTQRCHYIRFVRPKSSNENRTTTFLVQNTEFNWSGAHDDVVTYSMAGQKLQFLGVGDA